MNISYTVCSTAIGSVYVAWTGRGIAFLRAGARSEADFVAAVSTRRGGTPVRRDDSRLAELTACLEAWLAGKPVEIVLDLTGVSAFDRAVLAATQAIPRGEVRTYGELARAIRRPTAARAVGGALCRNPIPLLIPCHRVVSPGGNLRHYSMGGVGWKERLLRLEGVDLEALRSQRRTAGARGQAP